MALTSTQQQAAHHRRSGMVDDVCVPSGEDFRGSDFSILAPDHPRAVEYQQRQRLQTITAAESRRPS